MNGARGVELGVPCIAERAAFPHSNGMSSRIGMLVLAAFVLAACEMHDSHGDAGDPLADASLADASRLADAGPIDANLPRIEFTVRLRDATAETETFLPGVEVCAADREDIPCATSDADGRISIELPAQSEIMVRCQSDDYGPAYMTWAIGSEDIDAGVFGLLARANQNLFVTLSGARNWPARGALTANVYEDLVNRDVRIEGATFTIEPAGGGPIYVNEARRPDASLDATSLGGPGLFFDLEGEVTVTIHHPTRTCTGGFGWPTGDPAALRSRIFPGGLSNVTFVCPP
jgi:hypothetical protein